MSWQKMKPHKPEYASNNLARGFAIMQQVEGVRGLRVIREGNGQIAGQRLGHEAVDGFIQMRHFVAACSDDEEGRALWKIGDGFSRARVREAPPLDRKST